MKMPNTKTLSSQNTMFSKFAMFTNVPNQQQMKKLQIGLLLILTLTALAGCGSSKTPGAGFGSSDSASESPTATTAGTNDPNTAQATCSQGKSSQGDMDINLMQYVDTYGQTRPDYVRLQFRKAPTGWQSGNWDLSIYRWTAAPDNSTSIDPTPVFFQFEKKVPSGFQLLTDYSYQYFNWAEVEQMGDYAGVNHSTAQGFANVVNLKVNMKDSTNSYQVLRVVFRQDGVVVSQADVLVPTFQANPAKYNIDSRHPVALQGLHPLRDKLGQSWTETNYFEFARSFCF